MCGIVGYWGAEFTSDDLRRAANVLSHRGPDDAGVHLADSVPLGIAMRRLSIMDPAHGQQPMSSSDDRCHVVHNGEIYNFRAFRQHLQRDGGSFDTDCDTEVIVEGYRILGKEVIPRLSGMYALAVWDERRQSLLLARDPLGIKPLYYWVSPRGGLLFASELKALLQFSSFAVEPDAAAISSYLRWGYHISHGSLMKGVTQLPPGHMLLHNGSSFDVSAHWKLDSQVDNAISYDDAAAELRERLCSSVKAQLIADVDVSVSLSGGLDSSAVAACVHTSGERPDCYTVGYGEANDESPFAARLCSEFGFPHSIRDAGLATASNLLNHFVWHLEEPLPHIQIPTTYFLGDALREARRKVVLVGEGADELFGGYPRAYLAMNPLRSVFRGGGTVRDLTKRFLRSFSPVPDRFRAEHSMTGDLRLLMRGEYQADVEGFLEREGDAIDDAFAAGPEGLFRWEIERQLPNSQLLRVDKMLMASSVEARVPFLDHDFVQWANSLPVKYKIKGSHNKIILREAMGDLLPPVTLNRPKYGLTGTQSLTRHWLRDGLKDLVIRLTDADVIRNRQLFASDQVATLRQDFVESGAYFKTLFCIALTEMWCRIFIDGDRQSTL